MLTSPIATLVILVCIGIAVGLLFNRRGRGWLGRRFADATGVGDITYSLVGIAGAFMGYQIGVILDLLAPILTYLAALVGAAVTVFLWRGR